MARRDPADHPEDPADAPTMILRPAVIVPERVWAWRGLAAVAAAPTIVPLLNYVALGTLAREAGLGPLETAVAVVGISWVSGQVVFTAGVAHGVAHGAALAPTALSVFLVSLPLMPMVLSLLPLLRRGGGVWRLLPVAQLVSTVPWSIAQGRLPDLPPAARPVFFGAYTAGFVGVCLLAALVAHRVAGSFPPVVASLLIFVLPLHLLFSLARSARDGLAIAAIVAGLLLGPLAAQVSRDFALPIAGLVGGTAAFLWSRRRRTPESSSSSRRGRGIRARPEAPR